MVVKRMECRTFFTGLEASRKDVVWNCFGMPLTFTVYQKVIGSLVSIIILSMTFALRSSVTLWYKEEDRSIESWRVFIAQFAQLKAEVLYNVHKSFIVKKVFFDTQQLYCFIFYLLLCSPLFVKSCKLPWICNCITIFTIITKMLYVSSGCAL